MEVIRLNGKIYSGKRIFSEERELNKIEIFLIHPVLDKYLILHTRNEEIRDFVLTGFDKVYEVMLYAKKSTPEKLWKKTCQDLFQIKGQAENKSLKRTDAARLRSNLSTFYDKQYALFVYLGMKFPEFLERMERESA